MDIKRLEAELLLILGRVNGLHAAITVIARTLPPDVASEAARQLGEASERIHSDALASPVPDATVDEMRRVIEQLRFVLQAAAQDQQRGRPGRPGSSEG